jgi:hypothetical protein
MRELAKTSAAIPVNDKKTINRVLLSLPLSTYSDTYLFCRCTRLAAMTRMVLGFGLDLVHLIGFDCIWWNIVVWHLLERSRFASQSIMNNSPA